jgi:hypothetical protein
MFVRSVRVCELCLCKSVKRRFCFALQAFDLQEANWENFTSGTLCWVSGLALSSYPLQESQERKKRDFVVRHSRFEFRSNWWDLLWIVGATCSGSLAPHALDHWHHMLWIGITYGITRISTYIITRISTCILITVCWAPHCVQLWN